MKRAAAVAAILTLLCARPGVAAIGISELPGQQGDGPVTVFHPTDGPVGSAPFQRGPFSSAEVAVQGAPARGNGRLLVVSHGSGGSPWVHAGMAMALARAGFTVAFPTHQGDNQDDSTEVGPRSWERRPQEMSRAIDAVAADARFAHLLSFDRVGAFGMSAGGHTALSLAGGRWSPQRLLRHCEAHLAEDFHACAGLTTRLTGGWLDGLKKSVVLAVLRRKLDDPAERTHTDPRIAAVVSGVPFSADFDLASLARPRVPLAVATARQDRWLVERFHSGQVLKSCGTCEHITEADQGGHGALLSPLPMGLNGLLADLLADPPGFDRATAEPAFERAVTAFFERRLLP